MTTMRPEAVATIFSISSAPPPPLIRRSSLSSSSAPSTVMSRKGCWSSVMSGMPSRSACARVASEVGTHLTLRPAFTFCPTRSTKRAAVEPVPSPKRHAVFHQRQRAFGGLLLPVIGGHTISIGSLSPLVGRGLG